MYDDYQRGGSDDNSYSGTIGHAPYFGKYIGTITDPLWAGMSALAATVAYNFGTPDVKTKLSYAIFSQTDEGMAKASGRDFDGASEVALDVHYKIPWIKGLTEIATHAVIHGLRC